MALVAKVESQWVAGVVKSWDAFDGVEAGSNFRCWLLTGDPTEPVLEAKAPREDAMALAARCADIPFGAQVLVSVKPVKWGYVLLDVEPA